MIVIATSICEQFEISLGFFLSHLEKNLSKIQDQLKLNLIETLNYLGKNICRKCVGSTHHYLYEHVQKFHPIPPPKPKQKTKKEGREQTRKIIMVYSYLLAVFCTKSNEIYTNIIR